MEPKYRKLTAEEIGSIASAVSQGLSELAAYVRSIAPTAKTFVINSAYEYDDEGYDLNITLSAFDAKGEYIAKYFDEDRIARMLKLPSRVGDDENFTPVNRMIDLDTAGTLPDLYVRV